MHASQMRHVSRRYNKGVHSFIHSFIHSHSPQTLQEYKTDVGAGEVWDADVDVGEVANGGDAVVFSSSQPQTSRKSSRRRNSSEQMEKSPVSKTPFLASFSRSTHPTLTRKKYIRKKITIHHNHYLPVKWYQPHQYLETATANYLES
jgi:hypothetical protein